MEPNCKPPEVYLLCALTRESLLRLAELGVTVLPPEAFSAPPPPAALRLSKRVITERDLYEAGRDRQSVLRIGPKSILTALARDYAKDHQITLLRDAEEAFP